MIYDTEKRIFLASQYASLENVTLVQRQFRTKYCTKTVPRRTVILNIVSAFRKTGSVRPGYYKKREKRVQTDELVENIKSLFLEDNKVSVGKLSQRVPASRSVVRNVAKNVLHLKPYKKKRTFKLMKTDHAKRVNFAKWVLNKRLNLKKYFICSDEAYFYLNGGHNIQNDKIYANFQPNYIVEQPLHDEKVLVWCAFSGENLYGPYFFNSTVKWDNYLDMLKEFFWPKVLQRYRTMDLREKLYFQQDGAPPHRKKEVQ